ncbi:MAG: CBS domain-containing protein [Candidatus Aenigmarchaeota archaeon]|nr:CBS domain-containing protein [Candidatus Aenigmarchaeota archaeon]
MDLKFLQLSPLVFKNDPIPFVKNEMNKACLSELPVIDKESLIGTITARSIINFLRRSLGNVESLVAHHLLEKDFICVDTSFNFAQLAEEFIRVKRAIACVVEGNVFLGYIPRKRLLELLFKRKESIRPFVTKNYEKIRGDYGIKKIVESLRKELPILVYDEKPLGAFSPEELYFLIFINDFLLKKFERDFETLRAEERKFLRSRLDQQLLSVKKKELDSFLPPFKISDIARPLVADESFSVGEVAKIMVKNKRSCLAVSPRGVITDLDLLKVLL